MDIERAQYAEKRRRELEEQLTDQLSVGTVDGMEHYESEDLEKMVRWLGRSSTDLSTVKDPVTAGDLQKLFDRMAEDDLQGS